MKTLENNFEVQPLIIQYQISPSEQSQNIQGQYAFAHNINELLDLLKLHQTHGHLSTTILVVIQTNDFDSSKIDLNEFVSMIRSFYKCTFSTKPMYFAVTATKPITRVELRSLKNLDIIGLVPDSSTFDSKETNRAIQTLATGTEYWPLALIEQPAKGSKKNKDSDQIRLTPRQAEILSLVCNRGISNKKIAQMLNISESTVKVHISAILKAYRVRNRTQLALFAQQT